MTASTSQLRLSPLPHTWILDLDGTLVVHNGYLSGDDRFLPGALDFLRGIPPEDYVLILSARPASVRAQTEDFLHSHRVRYDQIIFGAGVGERILVNDDKPSGLCCALALGVERNRGLAHVTITIDPQL